MTGPEGVAPSAFTSCLAPGPDGKVGEQRPACSTGQVAARAPDATRVGARGGGGTSLLQVAVALAAVALVFGFAIPRLADYGAAWRAVTTLGAAEVATVLLAGLGNLVSYWPALVLALPGLRLREAALVNHASTAVANTVRQVGRWPSA